MELGERLMAQEKQGARQAAIRLWLSTLCGPAKTKTTDQCKYDWAAISKELQAAQDSRCADASSSIQNLGNNAISTPILWVVK